MQGSRIAVRMQSGYLYTYALVMLLGPRRRDQLVYGASAMNAAEFPILSIMLAVPVGRRAALSVRAGRNGACHRAGGDAVQPAARYLAVDQL